MSSNVTYKDASGNVISKEQFSKNMGWDKSAKDRVKERRKKDFFSQEGYYTSSVTRTERGTEQETKFHGSTRPKGRLDEVHESAKKAPTLTRGTRTYYEGASPTLNEIRPQQRKRMSPTITRDDTQLREKATSPYTPISTSQRIISNLYPQETTTRQASPNRYGGGEIQPDKSNIFDKAQFIVSNVNQKISPFIKQFKSTDPVTQEKDYMIGGTDWIGPQVEASRQRESQIKTDLESATGLKRAGLKFQLFSEKASQFIYGGEFAARERVREKPASVAADFGLAYGVSTGIAGVKYLGTKAVSFAPKLRAFAPLIKQTGLQIKRTAVGVYATTVGGRTIFADNAFERGKVLGEETVRVASFAGGARASRSAVDFIGRKTSLAKLRNALRADVDKSWTYNPSKTLYEPTGQKVFSFKGTRGRVFQDTRAVPRGELAFDTTGQPATYGGKMLRQMTLKPAGKSALSQWLSPKISSGRIDPSIQVRLSSRFKTGILKTESGNVLYKQPTRPTLRVIKPTTQETLGQSYLRTKYGLKISGKKGMQLSSTEQIERGVSTMWDVGSSLKPSLTKFTRTSSSTFSTMASALTKGQYSGAISTSLALSSALRKRTVPALKFETFPSLKLEDTNVGQLKDTLRKRQRFYLKQISSYSFLRQNYKLTTTGFTTTQNPILEKPLKDPPKDPFFSPPNRSRSFNPPGAMFTLPRKQKSLLGGSTKSTKNIFNPKYFASVEASVLNIRAKAPKTRAISTGLNIRPIKL